MISTRILSADSIAPASPAAIPCLLIASHVLAAGDVVALAPGDDLSTVLGRGLAADAIGYLFRDGVPAALAACAADSSSVGVWSPAPSVVRSGGTSGPAISCALDASAPGCLDDMPIKVTIVAGGANGTGVAALAYDGATVAETLLVPEEHPAVLRGAIDITHGADMEGLQLDMAAPAVAPAAMPAGSVAASSAGLHVALASAALPVTLATSDLLAPGLAELASRPRRLKFTTSGATPADAPANVAITGTLSGAVVTETLSLSQTANTVTSVHEYDGITTLAYPAGQGIAATVAVGYSSRYADAAEIISAINALLVAASAAARARVAEVGVAQYLEIVSTAVGASASVQPTDSADDFCVALGLPALASGAAATYTLPAAGLVLTFPAGTYVAGEAYSIPCTGPRVTTAGAVAAAVAAHDQYADHPFGFGVVAQPANSASNAAALLAALDALRVTWLADPAAPRDIPFAIGAPWHTASAVKSTNAAAIAAADRALVAAFATAIASPCSVVAGDVYIPGDPTLALGTFRRSAALAWALKRALPGAPALGGQGDRLAATVAEGFVAGASLTGPDGLTRARDENTATVKLGKLDGPGFFALALASDGKTVRFALGATRAGRTSRLRHDGDVAVCYETARQIQEIVEVWIGQRPVIDQATKNLADHERSTRAASVDAHLRPFLRPEPPRTGLPNVSDFIVAIEDPPGGATYVDSGITPVKATLGVLGTVTDVRITVGATGTTIAAPAGQ
jgi:hypothetical protein